MALTTVARVKAYLGKSDEANADLDKVIQTIVDAADKWFEEQTGRAMGSAARTDRVVYRGSGREIIPRWAPVISVQSVKVDGTTVDVTTDWAGGVGYMLVDDVIRMRGLAVEEGSLVELGYTAGYATAPADLAQAATELVAIKFTERGRVGTQTQSMAGASVTWLPSIVPQTVKDVVEHYRIPSVA